MFEKNLNNNWLASSDDKTDKKNNRKNLIWFMIKGLIQIGYYICKILKFFSQDSID